MTSPFSNQKARAPLPRRMFWTIMGCLFGLIAVLTFFNRFSPGSREAREFLRTMPVEQIREISIEPYAVLSLTDHVIVIRDRVRIERIAALFRGMTPVSPNHPSATWVGVIRFQLADRQYGGQIEMTNNQGGLFFMTSKVQGGWNYGAYRNDQLGPVFEALVAAEKGRK